MSERAAHRVVIHVHDGDPTHHAAVLRNVSNLLQAAQPDAIEVVSHGPGLDLLLPGSAASDDVRALQAAGVEFVGCANTLASRHLTPSDLVDGTVVVASGVAHLAERQWDGWAYLHP
jgi:intracellular sulfur oxidation DsrE/DsrF family protein